MSNSLLETGGHCISGTAALPAMMQPATTGCIQNNKNDEGAPGVDSGDGAESTGSGDGAESTGSGEAVSAGNGGEASAGSGGEASAGSGGAASAGSRCRQ